MTLADAVAVVVMVAVTAYAVLAGADFGGGFWDLLAGGAEKGRRERAFIDRTIGPVWEVNHIWIIVVLVLLWTCFPVGFSSILSTLWIPFALAALGIILRGAAFAMRREVNVLREQEVLGVVFATSSIITPFFLGAAVGGIASGRVPVGNAAGDPITSWLNPTGILGGVLAVATCAFLAATFLTADATRRHELDLADHFRVRGLVTGVVTGVIALVGIFVLKADDSPLFDDLIGKALPLVILSAVAGLATMALLFRGHPGWARLSSVGAVATIIWGWGVAQYPYLIEGSLTLEQAAGADVTLRGTLIALAAGLVILVPAFLLLYGLNAEGALEERSTMDDRSEAADPGGDDAADGGVVATIDAAIEGLADGPPVEDT